MTLLLKVVLHAPFMNDHNEFNQVGLVALNCMGEMIMDQQVPLKKITERNPSLFGSTIYNKDISAAQGNSTQRSSMHTTLPGPYEL